MKRLVIIIVLLLLMIWGVGCTPKVVESPVATLVAHYEFEDDLKDSTGNFGDGVVIGNKIGIDGGNITYTTGIVGKAVYLDGNSGIALPDNLIHSYNYSIAFWFKAEELTNFTPLLFGCVKDKTNEWLSIVPGGHPSFNNRFQVWSNFNNGTTWFDGLTNINFETNKWYHVAIIVNNGDLSVYVDGQKQILELRINGQVSLEALVPDLFSNNDAIFVLGVNYWDTPFKGMIDDLRIYQGVLSETEIAQLVAK